TVPAPPGGPGTQPRNREPSPMANRVSVRSNQLHLDVVDTRLLEDGTDRGESRLLVEAARMDLGVQDHATEAALPGPGQQAIEPAATDAGSAPGRFARHPADLAVAAVDDETSSPHHLVTRSDDDMIGGPVRVVELHVPRDSLLADEDAKPQIRALAISRFSGL